MGMTKKYYWLKLKDDFFTNKKIKKLRSIAGGDTYTIIYLKMQLLSIKNEGILFYEEVEETFEEELALEIDEDIENVKVVVMFLIKNGLLEMLENDKYLLTETIKCIGSESASAERVRKFRKKQALLEFEEEKTLQCNTEVTKCNTEIEKEKEIEKRDREDIDILSNDNVQPSKSKIDYQFFIDTYNNICTALPKVQKLSDSRKRYIKTFLKSFTEEEFKTICEETQGSDFLSGRNGKWTGANFDWIIKTNNATKVLEGNYKNKGDKSGNRKDITEPKRKYEDSDFADITRV